MSDTPPPAGSSATSPAIPLTVESLYGATTRAPIVKLTVGTQELPMRPDQARATALLLLEAAEAAEGDAAVADFFLEEVGLGLPGAAAMLHHFRAWRARRQDATDAGATPAE